MIKSTNVKINAVLSKDDEAVLLKICEKNKISKSVAIGVALACWFKACEKVGYDIADTTITAIQNQRQKVGRRRKVESNDKNNTK